MRNDFFAVLATLLVICSVGVLGYMSFVLSRHKDAICRKIAEQGGVSYKELFQAHFNAFKDEVLCIIAALTLVFLAFLSAKYGMK